MFSLLIPLRRQSILNSMNFLPHYRNLKSRDFKADQAFANLTDQGRESTKRGNLCAGFYRENIAIYRLVFEPNRTAKCFIATIFLDTSFKDTCQIK